MPIAGLYERYLSQVQSLQNQDVSIFNGYILGGQRTWMVPDPGPALVQQVAGPWDFNIFHLSGDNSIIAAFDRTEINNSYATIVMSAGQPSGGLVADVEANKIQLHWLAQEERALTLRYASPIRCAMHSAIRRSGHSASDGIFGVQNRAIVNILAAGYGAGPISSAENAP